MTQEPPERSAVQTQHPLFDAADNAFHPRLSQAMPTFFEQPRAHQRSQCQRYKPRGENRDDDRDRKLAEDPAHESSHEYEWNEHSGEGDRHRHDREADFSRTADRRFECWFTTFHAT